MSMSRNTLMIALGLLLLLVSRYFVSNEIIRHPLGKLILVLSVIYLSMTYGVQAGIISALFVIFLFQDVLEGMENKDEVDSNDSDKSNLMNETKEDDGEKEKEKENELQDEKHQKNKKETAIKVPKVDIEIDTIKLDEKPKHVSDLMDNNPGDLRNKERFTMANPEAAGAGKEVSSVPVGAGLNHSKPVSKAKEGFANFN
jgi:hypothetical protein